MNDYKSILENLGYKLTDRGSFWHTNAVYRGGDNPTAVQVYKNSGVWKDFVQDSEFMPFEALLEKTLNTKDKLKIRDLLKNKTDDFSTPSNKKFLKEEKTYDPSCLRKLLPHFDFYTKKGISKEALRDYQCGLATGGKLYQRIVFPIFNKDGKIHGFSGRKISDKNDSPKWLHMGKKMNWFYPYYTNEQTKLSISENKSVFLVESIGDSLALYDSGIKNNLVCFGLSPSPKFIANLAALDLEKIYICLNNDFENERNRGFEGAFKLISKLVDTIDFKKIYFCPPIKNDFGSMSKIEIDSFLLEAKNLDHKLSIMRLIEFGKTTNALIPENEQFNKFLKNICKLYNFNYG